MTPFQQAITSQLSDYSAAEFYRDLDFYFLNGYVHSSPEAFMMFRPVSSKAVKHQITDSHHVFDTKDCDTWFVYLAGGNVFDLISLAPYPLKYVCYERFGELKLFRFQSILEKSKRWERKRNVSGQRNKRH